MITIKNIDRFDNVVEIYGISSDTKPIGEITYQGVIYKIRNSSIFFEMDTSNVFLYDEENEDWIQQ